MECIGIKVKATANRLRGPSLGQGGRIQSIRARAQVLANAKCTFSSKASAVGATYSSAVPASRSSVSTRYARRTCDPSNWKLSIAACAASASCEARDDPENGPRLRACRTRTRTACRGTRLQRRQLSEGKHPGRVPTGKGTGQDHGPTCPQRVRDAQRALTQSNVRLECGATHLARRKLDECVPLRLSCVVLGHPQTFCASAQAIRERTCAARALLPAHARAEGTT